MKLFGLFGKKDVSGELSKPAPYRVITELVPYKLYSNRRSSVLLNMKIKNITNEPLMTSLVVSVPNHLSLDQTGLLKEKEVRLGDLANGEEKEARVEIFSDTGTDKGEYTITITAFAHYRDYAHILNSMRKRIALEAV